MEDREKELEELKKELHKNIEDIYGKDILNKFQSSVYDKQEENKDIEMLKVFLEDSNLNFGLDSHLDEEYGRLYLYPDGVDNQRECITVEYNKYAEMIYVSGHGEITSATYVCKPTQDEVIHCLMTVINIFRKDNEWTYEMPCEERYKAQNN